jgi:subtilisin family serine protease
MHLLNSLCAIASVGLLLASVSPSWAKWTDPQAVGTSAQHSVQTPRESFDEEHIIIRLRSSVIDEADSTPSKGESLEAKLNRTRRLDGLRGSLRLETLERVFKHSRAFGAGTAVGRRVAARHRGAFLVAIRGNQNIHDVLDEARSHPDVEQAQLNYIYTPDLVPTDPQYPAQYAHGLTDAELGWDIETGDPSVAMAIVGTGVELLHPDLAANIWENAGEIAGNGIDDDLNGYVDDLNGWDFAADDNNPTPVGSTHETEVAGVAGAVANNGEGIVGVAWDCRIMPLRVNYTTVDVANAIDYAADNGARVINMSFGNYDPGKYGPDTLVEDAATDAFVSGVVLVATAGNDSIADMRFPAALDDVIAVAATTSTDERATFSNYGSWVTVAAPGSAILSTTGLVDYDTVNGTSFAAPYVAGIAALLISADGSLNPTSVRLRIEYSVDKINPDLYIGTGRVNVANALSLTGDPDHFAVIKSPLHNDAVIGLTSVIGTALGDSYVLEYRATDALTWTLLSSGSEIIDGELGVLDENGLDSAAYELRLTVSLGAATEEDQIDFFVRDIKAGWPQPLGSAIVSSASYADIDSDGDLEVFVSANGGVIGGWYPDGTSIPGWPVSIGAFPVGSPAIGDVDGDGGLDILEISNATGNIYAFDRFGTPLPGWPIKINQKIRGAVALADLNGDEVLDVIAVGHQACPVCGCGSPACETAGKIAAIHGDGTPVSGWPVDTDNNVQSAPAIGDIDGDSDLEVVVHSYTKLYAFEHDGSAIVGWPISYSSNHTGPILVDYDGDGADEVLAFGRTSARLLRGDGSLIRSFSFGASSTGYGYAAMGEVDGMGAPEFCVGTDDGMVFLMKLDGGTPPGWPAAASQNVDGCAIADIDGDGEQEVVASSQDSLIYAWNFDGSPVGGSWPLSVGSTVYTVPVVGDLEGDNSADLIVGGVDGDLFVFELGVPSELASPEWPMLQGNAKHDGRYVPEPDQLLSLASGLALLGLAYRRRISREPREGRRLSG